MRRTVIAATLASTLPACFDGAGTVGSICRDDTDCGEGQQCTHEVCGRCGDGSADRGELCLGEPAEVSGGEVMPGDLLTLDLDGDGRLDLVLRGADGRVERWLGDGRGAWTVSERLDPGGTRGPLRPLRLSAGAQPWIDALVVDADAPAIHVGWREAGGVTDFAWSLTLPAEPTDVAAAGAVDDAAPWVAWVDAEGLWWASIELDADPVPEPSAVGPRPGVRLGGAALLDADARMDLVIVDPEDAMLEIWTGGATGLPAERLELEARPVDAWIVDVDGDGDLDVLVPDEAGGITVVVGDGEGQWSVLERVEVGAPVRSVAVADLNRDDERDLVVAVDASPSLLVLPGRGRRHPDVVALEVEGAVGTVVADDFDRDGAVELLLGPAESAGPLRMVEGDP